MSLKFFHIFFMTVCILFSLGTAVWCFTQPGLSLLGIGLAVLGILLVGYTIYFVKKMKKAGHYS
jgi:predicted benzoate:H+ symporter BenE